MQHSTFNFENTVVFLVLCLTSVFPPALLLAQNPKVDAINQNSNGQPGAFLRMGVGARALGLSGAFSAVADGPSAAFWNPAGLGQISNFEFEFMNVDLPFDRTYNFAGSVLPVGNFLTFGLSWIGLRINDIEGRSANTAEPEYFFGNSQNAFFFSLSRSIGRSFAFGANVKFIQNNLDTDTATGLGFDGGILLHMTDRLSLALLAQDIGTDYRWKSGLTEGVPMTFRFGTAYDLSDGFTLSADVNKTAGLDPSFHFGLELRPVEAFPVRVGYFDNRISGGLGVRMPLSGHSLELDYGYTNDQILNDDIHRVSLTFAFSPGSSKKYNKPDRPQTITRSSAQPQTRKPAQKKSYVIVNATVLNVRSGPGTNFEKAGQVKKNQKLELIKKEYNWVKIKLMDGTFGWVHYKYVDFQ
jgi:hypothetical protein